MLSPMEGRILHENFAAKYYYIITIIVRIH